MASLNSRSATPSKDEPTTETSLTAGSGVDDSELHQGSHGRYEDVEIPFCASPERYGDLDANSNDICAPEGLNQHLNDIFLDTIAIIARKVESTLESQSAMKSSGPTAETYHKWSEELLDQVEDGIFECQEEWKRRSNEVLSGKSSYDPKDFEERNREFLLKDVLSFVWERIFGPLQTQRHIDLVDWFMTQLESKEMLNDDPRLCAELLNVYKAIDYVRIAIFFQMAATILPGEGASKLKKALRKEMESTASSQDWSYDVYMKMRSIAPTVREVYKLALEPSKPMSSIQQHGVQKNIMEFEVAGRPPKGETPAQRDRVNRILLTTLRTYNKYIIPFIVDKF
ncbi:hypothetical protein BJ508DRAFT_332203 [Ascobolus immersus RN42]|uniref:Uncharacterized protein n=1 Tax=Ascobolus immersus RN42 TaxID=1160509 RepID=A0A3N4HNB1_ASCIM|nr:hypothetical protein BJ508DRAFT_332203 [Ascobolus immersus RN42]